MAGVDQSTQMLRRCRRKFPELDIKLGNLLTAPFFSGIFDFAVSSYALHHLSPDQQLIALREMDRLLKPKGRLAIADVMFVDAAHRKAHEATLSATGCHAAQATIEQHHFADRTVLVTWLINRGYQVEAYQLSTWTHLMFARKGAL
ncbi:hypothetical protein AAC03nite_33800 [Alicyclobacillus acidoterrestris]|nr:hypothetical protein AAC03nite_33800 [Alicyclobacillus acidoterrestris]